MELPLGVAILWQPVSLASLPPTSSSLTRSSELHPELAENSCPTTPGPLSGLVGTLSDFLRFAVRFASGRCPVILGLLSDNSRNTVRLKSECLSDYLRNTQVHATMR